VSQTRPRERSRRRAASACARWWKSP
jgi:hypothetical protein